MIWILADGIITVDPFKINGTPEEFRAWLDENWLTTAEFDFDTEGRLSITYRTLTIDDGGEDFYFNYNEDPIVEIPGTRRDREPDTEWAFLAKDEPKAYTEDMLPDIAKTWAPNMRIHARWKGTDADGEPIEGYGSLRNSGQMELI